MSKREQHRNVLMKARNFCAINDDLLYVDDEDDVAEGGENFELKVLVPKNATKFPVTSTANTESDITTDEEDSKIITTTVTEINEKKQCAVVPVASNEMTITENPLAQTVKQSPFKRKEHVKRRYPRRRRRRRICETEKELSRQRRNTRLISYVSAIVLIVTTIILIIFIVLSYETKSVTQPVCLSQECVKTAAFLLDGMDQSANPCEDFFQYSCGNWNRVHVIPDDKSTINTFEVLADQLLLVLRRILEQPTDTMDNAATAKAKSFYKSCVKSTNTQVSMTGEIFKILSSLGGWPVIQKAWNANTFNLEKLLANVKHNFLEGVLIDHWIGSDDKNSDVNVLQIDQMLLALPSKDYYMQTGNNSAAIDAYHKYMTGVAVKLGAETNAASTELLDIIKFESDIAEISASESERQDTSLIYKKVTLSELQITVPEINWKLYFAEYMKFELKSDESIVNYAETFFIKLGILIKHTDKRIIQNYVVWRVLMDVMVPIMTDEYQQLQLQFKNVLFGISKERNRWTQCVEWTNKKMGTAVGSLFIRQNFKPESKKSAVEMIRTIREAFNELLAENEWMNEATKIAAKEKANAMNERIGYPEVLLDSAALEKEYEDVEITEDNFVTNVLSLLRHETMENIARLHRPVDKDKWGTEPAVVNAYYNPNKNDIVFPAGILQPFFYSKYSPQSVNYGGIGAVIGHEITHGFDDKGRLFDKDGNMKQWWDNKTIDAFRVQTQCIIDQYSSYKIDEIDMYLNGQLTQGENVADNGGVKQSFRAYKKYREKNGDEPLLPGLNLNHEQLFFLNYAQIWCGTMRPEDALVKIRSSVHSPGKIRVWGTVSNSKDFARAFNCPVGSKMNPAKKCAVW